jgi:hypothetical protein
MKKAKIHEGGNHKMLHNWELLKMKSLFITKQFFNVADAVAFFYYCCARWRVLAVGHDWVEKDSLRLFA